MSKYYTLIVIFVGLLLQSCSDESKSTDCSQYAQNTQCETCQECQQCPTCKEGDECPAQSCPTCPTCKEGDECPACNCKECVQCKECPECNTDALNSQLTSCNNELTTTKQALETEQDANESCVGDLDTCNKDLSDLSAKPRSKSGSRLIFKEHKMSDGSVYVDPYPYDTKLETTCSFVTMSDDNKCCVPNYANGVFVSLSSFANFYSDDSCLNPLSSLSNSDYRTLSSAYFDCTKIGSVVFDLIEYNYCTSNYNNRSACIIDKTLPIYQKMNDNCVEYTGYKLVKIKAATLEDVKKHYVCEE